MDGTAAAAAFFGAMGALFLGVGGWSCAYQRRRMAALTETTTGTVVGFERGYTDVFEAPRRAGTSRPRVAFVHDGRCRTVTGAVGFTGGVYRVGQRVRVRFPPGDPDRAVVADFKSLYLLPAACAAAGAAVLGFAVVLALGLAGM